MSFLRYNDIDLSDIKTLIFDQRPVFTPDNTTYLYDEFTIRVHALMNAGLAPAKPLEAPARTLVGVRTCLTQLRKELIFSDNGNNLIVSPAAGTTVDAKNGPMPTSVNVKQITPATYSVEFEVKTWLSCRREGDCGQQGTPTPYLAHRWSETQQIDETFKSKWIRKGRIWFRSDMLAATNTTADDYRGQIVGACPLKARHIRVGSEYTVQEDGLVIDYTITDQEVYAVPLAGLVKFEAEYRSTSQAGAVFQEEMHVRVWGDNLTPKGTLFQAAATIAAARLAVKNLFQTGGGAQGAIHNGYFLDRLHENYVEIHLKLLPATFVQTYYGLKLGGKSVFEQNIDPPNPGSASDQFLAVPDPGMRGSDKALKLLANVLSDPCLSQTPLHAQPRNTSDLHTDVDINTNAMISYVPIVPNTISAMRSYEVYNRSYLTANIDIHHLENKRTLQMPYASTTQTNAAFAVVGNTTKKKVVIYELETVGDQPHLPATVSSDPNELLLHAEIAPANLDVEGDSYSNRWKVTGKYTYGIIDPTKVKINAAVPPYLGYGYDETEFKPADFVPGIISP